MPSNYPIYYVTCNDISRRFIIITGNRHFTDLSCLLLHSIRNFVVCTSFLEAARHSGSITLSCLNCTGQFAGTTNHMIFNNWRYLITIFGVHVIDAISERNLHVISFKSLSLSHPLLYSLLFHLFHSSDLTRVREENTYRYLIALFFNGTPRPSSIKVRSCRAK